MTPVDAASMPWDWVKKGLEHVIRKGFGAANWKPEDVYLALKNKQAFLYLLNPDSFVIVQRLTDWEGPYLFVWAIYGPQLLKDGRHEAMAHLRKLAVECGCRRLEMRSPRRWDATDLGWKARDTVFVAELWPEETQ